MGGPRAVPVNDSASVLKEATGGKISVLVVKCLACFRQLLSLDDLDEDEQRRSISASLRDEETRFRVWSGNIGAHKKGRSSLDYRLRDASHIQKQVINLLEDLNTLLDDAVAIVTGEEAPWDDLEDDALEPEGDLDDGIPDTELGQIAVDVVDVVNCLLRLSVSIRNPAPHDRFVASAPTETSYYEPFDVQHVRSKFGGTINEDLAVRLGKAISRRRQYFKYREAHHAKLCQGLDPDKPVPADAASTIASSIPRELKDRDRANDSMGVVNEDARSDGGVSETSFASSIAETAKLRVPLLPKEAEKGPFECPFCFMMITATNSVSWKRHVYGDLRPYVCLHADCPTPEREFARRHEWMEHEVANHWKTYHCPGGCDEIFPSAAACKAHVRAAHPDAILNGQLDAMTNLSARPLRFEDGVPCRLCSETLSSRKQYQRHVGRHQEQLSLFALPAPPQVEAEGGEERSDESDDGNDDDDGASGVGYANNEEDEVASDARDYEPEAEHEVEPRFVAVLDSPAPSTVDSALAAAAWPSPIESEDENAASAGPGIAPPHTPPRLPAVRGLDEVSAQSASASEEPRAGENLPPPRHAVQVGEEETLSTRTTTTTTTTKRASFDEDGERHPIYSRPNAQPTSSRRPVVVTTKDTSGADLDQGEYYAQPASSIRREQGGERAPSSPSIDEDEYRRLKEQRRPTVVYAQPASSIRRERGGERAPSSPSIDEDEYRRLKEQRRPTVFYQGRSGRGSIYDDEGFEYTKPSDLARYDLENDRRIKTDHRYQDGLVYDQRDRLQPRRSRDFIDRDLDESRRRDAYRAGQRDPRRDDVASARSIVFTESDLEDEARRPETRPSVKEGAAKSVMLGNPVQRDGDDDRSRKSRRESLDRYYQETASTEDAELAPRAQVSERPDDEDVRVRTVSPPRYGEKKPVTGILKQPKPQFPEKPNPVREGVAPHKDDETRAGTVPQGARWTKISRKMVSPDALTIGKERFEVRDDFVIVLRVLSHEEIKAYAAATATLRERRMKEDERRDEEREIDRRYRSRFGEEEDDGGDRDRNRDRFQRHRNFVDEEDEGDDRDRNRDRSTA